MVSELSDWLGMPVELRTPQTRAMVDAWLHGTPEPFATAYATYKQGRGSDSDPENIAAARIGNSNAMGDLWSEFINAAVSNAKDSKGKRNRKITITDPYARRFLAQARVAADGANREAIGERLHTHFQTRIRDSAKMYLYPGQEPPQPASRNDAYQSDRVIERGTLAELTAEADASVMRIQEDALTVTVAEVSDEEGVDGDAVTEELAGIDTVSIDKAEEEWISLANSIRGSAERLWRDLFLYSNGSPNEYTLSAIARLAQRLMLLWLEATLYLDRTYQNFEASNIGSAQKGKNETTRAGIRKHVTEYHDVISEWQSDLRKGVRQIRSAQRGRRKRRHSSIAVTIRSHQLEAQQLRRLIGEFAQRDEHEPGWASQAADAQDELRYQFRDELRREYWAAGTAGQRFKSLGMLILKFTSGYGTHPLFFVRTVGGLFLLDAVLFFLNDFFNPGITSSQRFCATSAPHIQQWTDVWDEIVRYAYIAVTHLTSLGLNSALSSYCGGAFAELVVIFSTVCGFFMLGLLSAMLYTQLSQSD